MKKKLLIFCILSLGLIIFGHQFYSYQRQRLYESITITFQKIDTIEYGSDLTTKDLIKSYVGEIVSCSDLDTNVVGLQMLNVVLSKGTMERTFEKEVIVEDTQSPIIELKEEKIIIEYNKSYNPKENVNRVYDLVDGELEYSISHNIKKDISGDYKVVVTAIDKHNNHQEASFIVTVKEKPKPVVNTKPMNVTYIQGILLVNKKYGLPSSFGGTNPTALNALKKLQNAANQAGYQMPLLSGYRSYSYQEGLYNSYVSKYGVALTDTFSARPGHSEHQTGLAFDVGNISNDFGETGAGIWLKENCAKYGFIIRYLKGKEHITGYKYEPWHIRYVGVEHATAIMHQGITLEEYLGVAQ